MRRCALIVALLLVAACGRVSGHTSASAGAEIELIPNADSVISAVRAACDTFLAQAKDPKFHGYAIEDGLAARVRMAFIAPKDTTHAGLDGRYTFSGLTGGKYLVVGMERLPTMSISLGSGLRYWPGVVKAGWVGTSTLDLFAPSAGSGVCTWVYSL